MQDMSDRFIEKLKHFLDMKQKMLAAQMNYENKAILCNAAARELLGAEAAEWAGVNLLVGDKIVRIDHPDSWPEKEWEHWVQHIEIEEYTVINLPPESSAQ